MSSEAGPLPLAPPAHRRMNAVSNALAATFLRLPFNEKQRLEANALLATHRMLWRFPEAPMHFGLAATHAAHGGSPYANAFEDEINEHGTLDRNDDSILEKGNQRKKRLGDRVVFRGGTKRIGDRAE